MYQQTTIVGNLGRDPELRFTNQGVPVCDFSVAVNKRYTTAGGDSRDETTWFRVTCWRALAETVAKYMKKGSKVMVIGEIAVSAYTDKNQQPAATLELTAQTVKFLDSRDDAQHSEKSDEPRSNNQSRTPAPTPDNADIPF